MTRLYLLAGLVAAALVVIVLAFAYGAHVAKQAARNETLTTTVDILREKKALNDQTRNLPDADLCQLLGGVPDRASGECM